MTIHSDILAILNLDSPMLLVLGLTFVVTALMWNSVRRKSRASRVDGRISTQADRHNLRLQSQTRDDIDELMVRLDELSREICGQIDTRYAKLEHLIHEAERVTAELRSAPGRGPAGDGQPESAAPAAPPPADPRHADILSRAEQGAAPVDIARQLGLTVGEIELVLSLDRSRRSQDLRAAAAPAPPMEPPPPEPSAPPAAPEAPPAADSLKRPRSRRKGLDERA